MTKHCLHFWRERHSHWGLTRERCRRCCSDCAWPLTINEHPARPRFGRCPQCHAAEDRWCAPDCRYIDPMDYR